MSGEAALIILLLFMIFPPMITQFLFAILPGDVQPVEPVLVLPDPTACQNPVHSSESCSLKHVESPKPGTLQAGL